ncbi:MAG: hypothetical protein KJ915_09245 [Candidatus Omnitrophica bacterium]|nr:hypothetical protein [Candidatus Omnitrophota bacterium]
MLTKSSLSVIFGSPKWLERRTFSFTIILETKTTLKIKPQHNYRNPIYLAKQYKLMIESGQARNESDLARQIGVSRVTVNHFIALLKLAPEVKETIEKMGDPMPKRYITERKLRSLVKLSSEGQGRIIQKVLSSIKYDSQPIQQT